MRGERRDRSRAAVIIKQKTMVDADNKEGGTRVDAFLIGARRSAADDAGAGWGLRGKGLGYRERGRYPRRRQRARRMWFHAPRST